MSITRAERRSWLAAPAMLMLLTGCGGTAPATKPAEQSPATSAQSPAEKGTSPSAAPVAAESPAGGTSAPPTAEATDDTPRTPASVADVAKVLDLRKFPLLPAAPEKPFPLVASLHYSAKSDVKSAFEFQRKHLLQQNWKEQAGSYVSDQTASASFARDGYHLVVSVFPGSDGLVSINIDHKSNVNLGKLPVPKDATVLYAGPATAMYVTESSVTDTVDAVEKLLTAQGWVPYGKAGDTHNFKQNAVELSATISSAPAQGNKTVIQYGARQLSADLPCPASAINVQYSEPPMQLGFDVAMSQDKVVKFLADALAKQGFEATTENPIKDDFRNLLIYRNPAKEYLELHMHEFEGKTRVHLEFETAEIFAEKERKAKAAILAKQAKDKAEADKPKLKLAIALPEGASDVEAKGTQIEFTVANGKAKAAVETLTKQLVGEGWKEENTTLEAIAGNVMLKKDDATLTVTYIDSGVIAPEISITAIGTEIEPK